MFLNLNYFEPLRRNSLVVLVITPGFSATTMRAHPECLQTVNRPGCAESPYMEMGWAYFMQITNLLR